MPLDGLGCTCATLMTVELAAAEMLLSRKVVIVSGTEFCKGFANVEFLVGMGHYLVPIRSLPFVHTARRFNRLNSPVSCALTHIRASKTPRTLLFRGWRSRNTVSVGEPADGSILLLESRNWHCSLTTQPKYLISSTVDHSALQPNKDVSKHVNLPSCILGGRYLNAIRRLLDAWNPRSVRLSARHYLCRR